MGDSSTSEWLYRYTNLASAIDILRTKRLTLLDPMSWPDQNDTEFLRMYIERRALKTLKALCFTRTYETSHHWAVYSGGIDGVRLQFRRSDLEASIQGQKSYALRDVAYRDLKYTAENGVEIDDLPFVKRRPYEGEEEVRLIFESGRQRSSPITVPLDKGSLERIVVSPHLPKPLKKTLIDTLKELALPWAVHVYQSTLVKNPRWISSARRSIPL